MISKPQPELFEHGLPPMRHQKEVFELSRDREYYAIWWEMGTGKSLLLLDTIKWLYLSQELDGVIIVSDKGAYLNWPIVEIPKCLRGIKYRVVTYQSNMRSDEYQKLVQQQTVEEDCLDILIMNVESFSGDKANTYAEKFIDVHNTMLAIDESTSISSIKSARTKNLLKLASTCCYRRILTGTPITHSPLNLYSQCEFLRPMLLGHRTFVGYRNEYAIMKTMTFGSRSFQTIAGYRHLDKLARKIEPFSSRVLKKDCLDLPDKVYEQVFVEQTTEQRKLYDDLKTYALSQFDRGLLSVTSAITMVNKLHQINCGHVKLDDGTVIDIPNNRIPILLDLLASIDGKVLIWCAFQRDVELIIQALEALPGTYYPVHYYGKTTEQERSMALESLQNDDNCRWFVGTAATGGKGLTLTVSHNTVYYSNSDSGEDRWQSEDRNHRKGQTNKVTYYDLITLNTVDEKILARLKHKKDIARVVLDEFRDMLS